MSFLILYFIFILIMYSLDTIEIIITSDKCTVIFQTSNHHLCTLVRMIILHYQARGKRTYLRAIILLSNVFIRSCHGNKSVNKH